MTGRVSAALPRTPSGPNDHATQREWEHRLVALGVQRYRESLVTMDAQGRQHTTPLAATEPGRRIIEDLVRPLAARIDASVDESIQASGRGADDAQHLAILTIPSDVLAVITVIRALQTTAISGFTGVASSLGTQVRTEWDYMRWKVAENAAEKQRKADGSPPEGTKHPPNMVKLMEFLGKGKNAKRSFARWSGRAELFSKSAWTVSERIQVGTALLAMLIETNAWFEARVIREGTRQRRVFGMTDLALAWVADRHNQNEMMRPFMLPMLCEPLDYVYIEPEIEECSSCSA